MTTEQLYDIFVANNTKGRNGIDANANYIRTYGDVPFEAAFDVYLSNISSFRALRDKIAEFEKFLIASGVQRTSSNVSESRYYNYNNVKYRISNHIYPTGSMTNEMLGVVDLAADPELINNVEF